MSTFRLIHIHIKYIYYPDQVDFSFPPVYFYQLFANILILEYQFFIYDFLSVTRILNLKVYISKIIGYH